MKRPLDDLVLVVATTLLVPAFAQTPPAPVPQETSPDVSTLVVPPPPQTVSRAASPPRVPPVARSSDERNTANNTSGATVANEGAPQNSTASMGAGRANVSIGRVFLGSGEPGGGPGEALQEASRVYDNLYHAPQYMPYFPTAGTIWPRVVQVPCTRAGADLHCEPYYWRPEFGRGEYLFFSPVVQAGAGSQAPGQGSPSAPDSGAGPIGGVQDHTH